MSTSTLISSLAKDAYEHRLVPFVGAGCSLGHIPVSWDQIATEMAVKMPGCTETDNMKVAELFARRFGDIAFADFLRGRLLIAAYDDGLGATPLQVLALELRSIYTTNQDNVLELAAMKYGRPRVVVSILDDLATVRPGDRILYKFHGSLDRPGTVVFTESQYQKRMAQPDHFMNIRLRSDLLTKKFFFIGYSFRDPNIQELFAEMGRNFAAALPGSFLVAYRWSTDLDELCRKHGVECVNPADHISASTSDLGGNLAMFLRELCEESFSLNSAAEMENLLVPKRPAAMRVAIPAQVEAMAKVVSRSSAATGLATFRRVCDDVNIPESARAPVAAVLCEITRKVGAGDLEELDGAWFNLRLPPDVAFEAAAEYLALANRIPRSGLMDRHVPPEKSFPAQLLPLVAAHAIELMDARGEAISDSFLAAMPQWFDHYWMDIPDKAKPAIRQLIAVVWTRRHTTNEDPVKRAERVAKLPGSSAFKPPSFFAIRDDLMAKLPREFYTPRES